jgi:hypothetical protein
MSLCGQSSVRIFLPFSGCYWNDTCYNENETWNDTAKCIEYQCRKEVGSNSKGGQSAAAMQVLTIGYGMIFVQFPIFSDMYIDI